MEKACGGLTELNINSEEATLKIGAKNPRPVFDPEKTIIPLFKGNEGLEDAHKIISIYLSKGTILTNILQTSKPDKKKIIQGLIKKYKLKDRCEGDTEIVTVRRVAEAFPILTITILHSIQIQRTVSRDNFLNTRIKLPMEMTDQIFLCTIPCEKMKEDDVLKLIAIVVAFAVKQSRKLNHKKFYKMSDQEVFDAIKGFLRSSMMSKMRNEEENVNLAKKLKNIYVDDGENFELTEDVIKIGDEALKHTSTFKLKNCFRSCLKMGIN